MPSDHRSTAQRREEMARLAEDPTIAHHRDTVFHALAHPFRRAIIIELQKSSREFQELVFAFPSEARTLHYHLRALRNCGLVTCRRVRPYPGTYAICPDVLQDLATMIPIGSPPLDLTASDLRAS